ncbi:MAG: hypothetical protein Q8R70_12150, partial [Methanoregula sp.]|nr:hypothetical protein [Methanoregula sp.]
TTVVTTTTTAQPTGSVTTIATTATQPAPTATNPVTANPTTTETVTAIPATTFSSADRKVSITGLGIDYAALMMVSQTSVPDTWLLVSSAYALAPESLTFSPPATLSFVTPASGNNYAYFIGRRVNNDWTVVSSTPGTGTIDAEIDRAGTYALMAFKPESTIQPTVSGTGQVTTPTPLVKETARPKIASIAQASPSSGASSAKPGSNGLPLTIPVIVGAIAIGIAAFAIVRR